MLVFDGSASMFEIGLDTTVPRIEDARIAVARIMPQVAPVRRIGLVTYGPGPLGPCQNIDLRFPPIADAAGPVVAAIDDLKPAGLTPLTDSVLAAAEALDYRRRPGIVVLVTDGNETCGGRPCALGEQLKAEASALTVHVIGFKVTADFWPWNNPEQPAGELTVARCLADRTGGMFVTTETVDELAEALRRTLGCPVVSWAGPWDRPRSGHAAG